MINKVARQELNHIIEFLESIKYKVETHFTDETFTIESENRNYIKIIYSEEGERSGYSLYDLDLIIRVDHRDYIYILSERLEDSLKSDFNDLAFIVKSVSDNLYSIEHERHMVFWKRHYLKVESDKGAFYLLRTRLQN